MDSEPAFRNREGDVPEQGAGILAAVAAGALLVGHAVVIHRHQQLGVPLQAHNGEPVSYTPLTLPTNREV